MQNLQILANIGVSRVRMWRAGCLAEDSVQTVAVMRGGHADNGLEEQRLQNWGSASRYRDSRLWLDLHMLSNE